MISTAFSQSKIIGILAHSKMDLDISDILADISHTSQLSHRQSHSHQHAHPSHYPDTDSFTDHQLLTRSWTSERCAPDLLPWPSELMSRIMSRVANQIARIEDMAAGMSDPSTSTSSSKGTGNANINLTLSILQTDLSRTQFLIRSYLRQRLAKVTKHAPYYLSIIQSSETSDAKSKYLSPSEIQFLRHHQALLSELYDASFLSSFPAALRRLDDTSGGVAMVEAPNGAGAVVVRCLAEGWGNAEEVENGSTRGADEWVGATVELRMRRGEVWVVRWRDVKSGVERGGLELL